MTAPPSTVLNTFVEREHGSVAEVRGADAVFLHAKGVRGVVDYFKAMLFRNRFDGVRVAERAVDMYGDDGGSLLRNERLNLRRIHRVGHRVDVTENGLEAITHDSIRRRYKGEGCRNHFAREPHGGDDCLQRKVPICKQGHQLHAEILPQRGLEFLMLFTHVGQPVAVPDGAQFLHVFFKGRK